MKKLVLFLFIIISSFAFAQIPQAFKYQAVVRDAAGVLAVNRIISVKTSILVGSATGASVYTETQTLSTNEYGVVSLNIGAGTVVSGNFSTINWGATTYFVKTELDINGGSTYVFMGTSQILSVPYALYAETTGSSLSDHDTSATNELQNLSIVNKNLSISNGNTILLPQDSLSIAGYTLGITNGNTINLPSPQTISIIGDSLHISNGNAVFLSGSVDLDASPTNELQTLSLNSDTLKISLGNNVVFPHDDDRDSINEIQNLSIVGKVISISKANSITLKDNDSLNEIQTLNLTQGSLKLSKANTIHLPDSSATNELQNISVTNDTLISISQGNMAHINTSRSLKFPEGVDGTPVALFASSIFPYTVPLGKNFYLTTKRVGTIWGLNVFPEGATITYTGEYIAGMLVDKTSYIQIVSINVNSSGTTYTVPAGKYLYLKSSSHATFLQGLISGINYPLYTTSTQPEEPLIIPPGTILSSSGAASVNITGYLK